MNVLSAEQLLLVWEQAHNYSLLQKTLLLLNLVTPESEKRDVELLSIGQRDTHLLKLRNYLFGSTLHNTTNCPNCKSKLEWDMNLGDLIIQETDKHEYLRVHSLNMDDFQIKFRLPNSKDIIQFLSENGDKTKPYSFLRYCILEIVSVKSNKKIQSVPENIINALIERISELDPAADIRINISCPSCGYKWEAIFDIMSYLWSEIDNWAHKTLQEVYILASAFGWPEKDILNMDAKRRQTYIEMIRS